MTNLVEERIAWMEQQLQSNAFIRYPYLEAGRIMDADFFVTALMNYDAAYRIAVEKLCRIEAIMAEQATPVSRYNSATSEIIHVEDARYAPDFKALEDSRRQQI